MKMPFSRWVDKWWHIQRKEYYSVLKTNALSSHEKSWRELKFILLSESRLFEKVTYCMIPTIWYSGKGKTMETVKRPRVSREGGMNRQSAEGFWVVKVCDTTMVCHCAKSLSHVRLCDPMDCSPPGSSVFWNLQTRILEWIAMPSSRGDSWPRDRTWVSSIGRWVL